MSRQRQAPAVSQVNKKEKPADVSARKLRLRGYRYKMQELTKQERKQQKEGIIEYDEKGKAHRYDPPDYNYYYKTIGDVTVKIFKAGDKFYYKNAQFRHMADLPKIEENARLDKVYEGLEKKVVDTKPPVDSGDPLANNPSFKDKIELVDGPLHGSVRHWNVAFPVFMVQYTNPNTGRVDAARYRNTDANKYLYIHFETIEGK